MIPGKKEKYYACPECGFKFSGLDVPRSCSNCFACTGCEIYLCPACKEEVIIKPIKQVKNSLNISNLY